VEPGARDLGAGTGPAGVKCCECSFCSECASQLTLVRNDPVNEIRNIEICSEIQTSGVWKPDTVSRTQDSDQQYLSCILE
jgi:hypothetical protein